jgi:predicted O-methyltransferase YrrM
VSIVDEAADALEVVWRSSRGLIRQARGRYTTDLLKWPYRHEFDPIWEVVDLVPGWFHEGSAVVMYSVMQAQTPDTVVEIGSYLGRSTVFFGLTMRALNPRGRVIAIDPHTGDRQQLEGLGTGHLATSELFRQHCQAARVEDLIEAHVESSMEVAAGWREPVDLLYVDGWHSYDAVVDDGQAWLPHLSPESVVIFDDYVAYDEVRRAVHALAASGSFRLWGSIFGQAVGGVAADPPPALRRALALSSRGLGNLVANWRR